MEDTNMTLNMNGGQFNYAKDTATINATQNNGVNLVNGFRLSAGCSDNRFIRYKFRIPHGKAPPFFYAAFVRHCVCDATPYFGSVRIVPRFPAVCNVRKSKDK